MRSLFPLLFLLSLLDAGIRPAHAQDAFTLESSIRSALAASSAVRQAETGVQAAEGKVRESRSGLYPTASIAAGYLRMGPVQEFSIPLGPKVYTMQMGVENSYSAGVGLQYQVFNWGRTGKSIDVNEWARRITETGVAGAKTGIAWQMTSVFHGILLAEEALTVLEKTAAAFEKRLAAVRIRCDAGLMSRYDLKSVEVQLSAARGRILDMRANRDRLRTVFNRLTGRPADAEVRLTGSFDCAAPPPNAAALLREAEEKRLELRQLRMQEEMSLRQAELSRTGNKPILALTANYGFRNGFFPDLDVMRQNWNAGVNLSWPLFDGFRTDAQVEQAEINTRLARLRVDDLRESVALEIRQALIDLNVNREKIALEDVKREQAEEALAIAEERYQKGLQSTLEVLDAQNSLESARLNRLQAVYNCVMSRFALEKAAGISPYAE